MLQGQGEHLSFHTPGHKQKGWDITELSYSDNLSCPNGCLLRAEQDVAAVLGAYGSFLLTDGSTCGVLSMLYAAKSLGVKSLAFCEASHKSLFNGCALLGITPLLYPPKKVEKVPFPYTMYELTEKFAPLLEGADGIVVTSPDYYGRVADLEGLRAYCNQTGKLLLIDGAHGGHLHFDKKIYAGAYADLWVDGVHKSLPALTQGAVVSARTERFFGALRKGVDIFRTTSPSYPIMASVEYAVKYPRNEELERRVKAFQKGNPRLLQGEDWTKACALFGKHAFAVQKLLEEEGIFAEFCDGNVLTFYLSPASEYAHLESLQKRLTELFAQFPYEVDESAEKELERVPAPLLLEKMDETEWVELNEAEGEICANVCGLFPPCTPLIRAGEKITREKIALLQRADNAFGLRERRILILKHRE